VSIFLGCLEHPGFANTSTSLLIFSHFGGSSRNHH
jgi:hypothetical protein